MSLATSILSLAACVAAATPPIPPERCPLPGTACRPDGPWPQTKCNLLLNATACDSAIGTPVCNSDGCAMHGRCTWDAAKGSCASPPPPPPPQPCAAIHAAVDCVWSNGRDCVWKDGGTGGVCDTRPAPPPLPNCVHDHSCADNGLSTTPPMGWRSWNLFAGKNDDATMRAMMNAFVDKSRTVGGTATALSEIGYLSVGMDDGYVLCVRAHVCVCVRVCVCSTWYLCSHSLIVSTPLLLRYCTVASRYQLCNCSGSHGEEDLFPHSLYNVSCSGDSSGQEANACAAGRCAFNIDGCTRCLPFLRSRVPRTFQREKKCRCSACCCYDLFSFVLFSSWLQAMSP